MCRKSFKTEFKNHVEPLQLTSEQKSILLGRYAEIVEDEESSFKLTRNIFKACKTLITIGSIVTMVLANVGNTIQLDDSYKLYIAWAVTLFGAINVGSNQIMSGGLSKRYILSKLNYEKLKSEGWYFVSRAGKYNSEDLDASFKAFIEQVETMKTQHDEMITLSYAGTSKMTKEVSYKNI